MGYVAGVGCVSVHFPPLVFTRIAVDQGLEPASAALACGGQVKGCQAGLMILVSSFLSPQVNVMAVSICTREAYQSMKERNIDDGHIININRYANAKSATWASTSPPHRGI